MISRIMCVRQAIKKSVSILAQSALSWDSMYLHVFKRRLSGRTFPGFIQTLWIGRNIFNYDLEFMETPP